MQQTKAHHGDQVTLGATRNPSRHLAYPSLPQLTSEPPLIGLELPSNATLILIGTTHHRRESAHHYQRTTTANICSENSLLIHPVFWLKPTNKIDIRRILSY
ncbi:hypothetical protein HanIR_Chr13g0622541 [Helianthus annuus]|nr:hypothetical protein HanIR_Chr13g0622541 [Helianthus annuus]